MPVLPLARQGQSNVYYEIDNKAYVMIPFQHHMIHEGYHFYVSGFTELDTDGTLVFAATTPSGMTKEAHMRYDFDTIGAAEFEVYKNSTITGGSSATPVNNKLSSTNTAELVVKQDPTISVSGTLIASHKTGAVNPNPNNLVGGDVASADELILDTNKTYIWKITSKADNNVINYTGYWYELPSDYSTTDDE